MASFAPEDPALDPQFFHLQEELRAVLFSGLSNLSPSRPSTPAQVEPEAQQTLNFSSAKITVPHARLIQYLQNWITECAPHLDKFDEDQSFQIEVPLMAQKSPALLYAMLAFSARQMERRGMMPRNCDSLELYQESIRLLSPGLQAKDPNMLVTACILAVFELMSGDARDWKRHVEGCASLFEYFGVNGFTGGLPQAVFWCYARMELCGAIISDGAEATVLALDRWYPPMDEALASPIAVEQYVKGLFHEAGRGSPDMHANWAIYLCTRVCDLRFRRTQFLELGITDFHDSRPFAEQWEVLWAELKFWLDERPPSMRPILLPDAEDKHIFPTIMFPHWAAISSNQVYHAACILMLEMQPPGGSLDAQCLALWHARQICGISCANAHPGSMVNSIQPLYIAGRLFSHVSERQQIAQLLRSIDRGTGWGALWRLKDLETEWGYEAGGAWDNSHNTSFN
ncbi:Transcription activator AMTR1 [Paramyrothecium foliicola]|nr:Transcription activator AMTR1 [Paramyrothecium foliicola]